MATYTADEIANFNRQLAQIDAILATGAQRTEYPDKTSILYRSLDDLRQIRSDLQAKVDSYNSPTQAITRRVVITSRSGW